MTASAIQEAAIFAQANLDKTLPLSQLASIAELSPHHFHRLFAKEVGETPAAFVQRLRLEKAAFRLLLHEDSIICVALDCGYANHETLTRAFRRHFGLSPREYRQRKRFAIAANKNHIIDHDELAHYRLSATSVTRLKALPIAFIRSTGPYEDVDPSLWTELNAWVDGNGLPRERMLIGIGHDAPGITASENLRFDACITIPETAQSNGRIQTSTLPPLLCAMTTHIGPYTSLPTAYPEIFARAAAIKGYDIIALPAIEVYRDPTVDSLRSISCTDIYLPVRRTGKIG